MGAGLVGSCAVRLALRAFSPHDVRIPSVVKEQMSPRLRDLCDHSSQSSALGLLRRTVRIRAPSRVSGVPGPLRRNCPTGKIRCCGTAREGLPTANKLQGLNRSCWSGWGFWIVVRSLCDIEDLGVVSRPSHPGEAHGSSQHITGNMLYRSLLSGRNTNGVVDTETTSPLFLKG